MDKIVIEGNTPLQGRVAVSGAKNAVLPVMAACLLTPGSYRLNEIPQLTDVNTMAEVLRTLGADVRFSSRDGSLLVRSDRVRGIEAPDSLIRCMRASFLVVGPLLARLGRARVSLPGGCAIGSRPIDLHLKGFAALGADIRLDRGMVEAVAPRPLRGARIYLDFPSVGATENIMMAAVTARGQTVLENAAEEPEIIDLANFLNSMGAHVTGAGTKVVKIEGVHDLRGVSHTVIPDRIEAGTFMVLAAASGGDVLVENIIEDHLKPVVAKLREAGVEVGEEEDGIRVKAHGPIQAVDLKTMPYPGFPTDVQAQFMALLATARGTSVVTETVFENRFMHVHELRRMGADIIIEGHAAIVKGVPYLSGARVHATDLRAGAALLTAGLAAHGETELYGVEHIDRGYENITSKLRQLGARLWRVPVGDGDRNTPVALG